MLLPSWPAAREQKGSSGRTLGVASGQAGCGLRCTGIWRTLPEKFLLAIFELVLAGLYFCHNPFDFHSQKRA